MGRAPAFAPAMAFCFNHESPRRGETFVSRKVSRAVAAIKQGVQKELFLGNLDAKRDWGYAPEYVEGMWRIVQLGEGDDFVLATGETHTVREFVEAAFAHVDLDWKQFVKHDPRYERPAEVDLLQGDASKAKKILDWEPKVRFEELVRIMVDADMDLLSRNTVRNISASCRELSSLTPRLKPGVNEIDEPLPNASQTAPCFPVPLNDLRPSRGLR
jgi:GDP-mannose 4,6-dehydratase